MLRDSRQPGHAFKEFKDSIILDARPPSRLLPSSFEAHGSKKAGAIPNR